MKKIQIFILLLLLFTLPCPPSLASEFAKEVRFDITYPQVTAPYALLVDAKYDEVLFSQNATEKAYPASTTKIMTALLVVEAIDYGILSLDTMVTATEASTVDLSIYGSTQGITPGETMSVQDLLYCLMLASANEAGNILGIAVAEELDLFIQMMNDKATQLGCQGTHFANTHGYHNDDHYTTAFDLFLIFQEALTYPLFREIVGTSTYTTAATNQEKERLFYNTNGLLSEWYYKGYSYEHCIGGKTGSTPEAGRCLVSAAEMGNEYVIAVVLGAEPVTQDDGSTLLPQMSESRALLKFGMEEFDRRTIAPGTDPVGQIPVTLSDENEAVLVKADGFVERTLPISMDLSLIETEVTVDLQSMEAPVSQNTVVGSMILRYQGVDYGSLDVVTMHDVARSEILYQKQQMESFVGNWGIYMVFAVVAMGLLVAGVQIMMQKRRRRHGWRSNQRSSQRNAQRPSQRPSHKNSQRKNRHRK